MKIRISLFLLFSVIITSVNAQSTNTDALNGIWKMRGYGKMIEINDTVVKNYDLTLVSCTLNSQIKKESIKELGRIEFINKDIIVLNQGITNYFLDRIEKLPTVELNSEKLKDPNYNFDVFWNTMNENYPFFDTRKMDWLSVKKKYGDGNINNERQLRRLLKQILRQLNDGHTTLFAKKKTNSTPHYRTNNKTSNLEDKILNHYVKLPKRYGRSIKGNGLINYGITENNVGYIQINNMMFFSDKYKIPSSISGYDYLFAYLDASAANPNHFEEEKKAVSIQMKNMIHDLKETDAIIMDLRFNLGGYDLVSLEVLKYFINKETKLYSKKAKVSQGFTEPQIFTISPADITYNKPVFLLTSHLTASAPEALVLGSMTIKNMTRVGSDTEGIFSDILDKKLPNSWLLNLSNEVYQNADGICYENVGIPPNIEIDYPLNENLFIRKLSNKIDNGDEAIEKVFKLIQK